MGLFRKKNISNISMLREFGAGRLAFKRLRKRRKPEDFGARDMVERAKGRNSARARPFPCLAHPQRLSLADIG